MWASMVFTLMVAPAVMASDKPDDSAKDLAALSGKWLIVSAESQGMDSSVVYRKRTLIVIEDGKLHFTDGFVNSKPAKFKLNTQTMPKSIDLCDGESKEKVVRGIYEMDKETLKLCINYGAGERPKVFQTKSGDKSTYLVLQKQKP